jgi:hypothetical protein
LSWTGYPADRTSLPESWLGYPATWIRHPVLLTIGGEPGIRQRVPPRKQVASPTETGRVPMGASRVPHGNWSRPHGNWSRPHGNWSRPHGGKSRPRDSALPSTAFCRLRLLSAASHRFLPQRSTRSFQPLVKFLLFHLRRTNGFQIPPIPNPSPGGNSSSSPIREIREIRGSTLLSSSLPSCVPCIPWFHAAIRGIRPNLQISNPEASFRMAGKGGADREGWKEGRHPVPTSTETGERTE